MFGSRHERDRDVGHVAAVRLATGDALIEFVRSFGLSLRVVLARLMKLGRRYRDTRPSGLGQSE